ncbi:hypothetical protein [Bradyrhizobium sp. USDA 4473]
MEIQDAWIAVLGKPPVTHTLHCCADARQANVDSVATCETTEYNYYHARESPLLGKALHALAGPVGQTRTKVIVKDPPTVVWAKQPVISKKTLVAQTAARNPGCGAGMDSNAIYPSHPGGFFVANTRTTLHSTNGPESYTETFIEPDVITASITQSTGACEPSEDRKGPTAGELSDVRRLTASERALRWSSHEDQRNIVCRGTQRPRVVLLVFLLVLAVVGDGDHRNFNGFVLSNCQPGAGRSESCEWRD